MKFAQLLYKKHLDEGEEIVEIIHRHWLVLKKKIAKPMLLGILPPLVLFVFYPGFWPVLLLWLIAGVIFYIIKFFEWYFDCLLLTTVGVVDVERKGIFDNASKKIEYHTIDGISFEIKGVLPTLMNYGDIVIDKMGSGIHINLYDAPNPSLVNKKIMDYQAEFVKEKTYSDHEALKGMLADMIATHVKEKGGYSNIVKKKGS